MLICPKCNSEYEEGVSVCSDCGTKLVEHFEETNKNTGDIKIDKLDWLKGFGNISAKKAMTILFYLGTIPLFISSIMIGRYIYLSSKYLKDISYIQNGMRWYTSSEVNNLPLGIFLGSVYFVVGILVWKIICELLIIIFRCFETYVRRNNRQS